MKTYLTFIIVLVTNLIFAQNLQFSELLNYYKSEKHFNGVVLVATNGKIDFLSSVGIGNRQNGSVLNTKSKFKIASMTKVFTAVMIMKLVEENKLFLGDTIGEYLPNYQGEGKDKVTIHQLLTYSSGIQNILDSLGLIPYQVDKTLDDFIESYCSGQLLYPPGEKSEYGNTEYILLHKIIETVSKVSYDAYLKEAIVAPLGLEHTQMVNSKEINLGLLPSYTYEDSLSVFYNDAPYYPELYFGSGALYSTVEDLLKFDQALFTNTILNKESTEKLLTIHPELGYTAYGLWGSTGWGNFSEPFYYRTGAILGANANWIHTMEKGKTIIVLSNTNATNLYELSEKMYLTSIGKRVEIPATELENNAVAIDVEKIKGNWKIDLRPTPNSEPYLKDLYITEVSGNGFSGEFYGSQFSNALVNNDWGKLHFAFTTIDNSYTYYHSGYFSGNRIYGTSYSEGRKFISYWQGTKE
ncbi:serine hydrolase domain-containing protein [Maribacter sp. CXY002]|uniref:serine hydrolase domain-containing protein n=1 Tax=Maribacter luteocoastalis TaxID=3407671 RepID=UPI003B672C65